MSPPTQQMASSPLFGRIERSTTAVDRCAEALEKALLDGMVVPGQRLPPERKLADQLQVNRTTLRAAIGQLQARGLLDVRQGSGATVRDFRRFGGPDLLPGLTVLARRDGAIVEVATDLLAMRRHLAAAVLERLSTTPVVDTDELTERIEAMAKVLADEPSMEAIAEADLAVLAALLAATGSAVFQLCFNPIAAVLQSVPELRDAMYARPQTNVAGWRALVAWLQLEAPRSLPMVTALLAERDKQTLALLNGGDHDVDQ